jgi:hypothetical protein
MTKWRIEEEIEAMEMPSDAPGFNLLEPNQFEGSEMKTSA